MPDFDKAVDVILSHEGGEYTNDPADLGGPTKWGITLKTMQIVNPYATVPDVKALTRELAKDIYFRLYWEAFHIDEINDSVVATKVFDIFVNMSPRSAALVVQKALARIDMPIVVDGVMGRETIDAINGTDGDDLIYALVLSQQDHYRARVRENPTQEKFLRGWLVRASWPLT